MDGSPLLYENIFFPSLVHLFYALVHHFMPPMQFQRETSYTQGVRHGKLLAKAQQLLQEERK